jgi:predicted GNAT family N-acyltransferase
MSTPFLVFQPPPGAVLDSYNPRLPFSEQDASIPDAFKDCMSVRQEVFVTEQNVPAENELDKDDARSFHWVVYASVSNSHPPSNANGDSNGTQRKGSETSSTPVGVIRLVPPPYSSVEPTMGHSTAGVPTEPAEGTWNPHHEPYIKLGRLATLKPYRKLGLGRLLVNAALEWAREHPREVVPAMSPTTKEASGLTEDVWNGLVCVHAQVGVERAWTRYGFKKDEAMGEWDEEGIMHVGMWCRLNVE